VRTFGEHIEDDPSITGEEPLPAHSDINNQQNHFSATRHDFLQKEESEVPRRANTAVSQTIGNDMEIGNGAITAKS